LLREGQFVRVLDNFSSGKVENVSFALENKNFQLIEGDIRELETCCKACEGIDFVLHQAALRSVPKSLEIPHDFNEVNIQGTLNMLEAAKRQGVKRFIYASSSSVYGEADSFPEREEDAPKLISPYALTKLAGEYYCRVYSHLYGVESICLRYFNVFGPRQALDDEYAVVIPKFITSLLRDESPPIHGTGEQSRDFTFVDNVVEANILATQASGVKFEILNVSNGKDFSVLELAETLNRLMGKSIKPIFTPPRPGDIHRTLGDISRAKTILGYTPKVDFEEGLRKTIEWFRNC
jgi:nucleoside-diphosphate-sugar epimerase